MPNGFFNIQDGIIFLMELFPVLSSFTSPLTGGWGTTYDFITSFLQFSLFSTILRDLVNSRPVHSLMLSSHFFFSVCHVLFPLSLCLARWFWPDLMISRNFHTTSVCVISYNGQGVFMWSDCMLDLGTDFLIDNILFVRDA